MFGNKQNERLKTKQLRKWVSVFHTYVFLYFSVKKPLQKFLITLNIEREQNITADHRSFWMLHCQFTPNKETVGSTRRLVQYCPFEGGRWPRYFEGYLEFRGLFKHISIYSRLSCGIPEDMLRNFGWGTLCLKSNRANKNWKLTNCLAVCLRGNSLIY